MRIKQNKMTVTGRNNRQAGEKETLASGSVLPLSDEQNHLKRVLARQPDVRAEKVARGEALIANPNYPSKEQIKKVASLLAENWNQADTLTDASVTGVRDAAIL